MTSAIESAFHVILGGKDYSNGAIDEQGRDFFNSAYPKYKEAQYNGYKWDSNQDFIRGDYTPVTNPDHPGFDGTYKYIIRASYGGNIYCTPSPKYKKIR